MEIMTWTNAASLAIAVALVADTAVNTAEIRRLSDATELGQLGSAAARVACLVLVLCVVGWAAVEEVGQHRPGLLAGVALATVSLSSIRTWLQNDRTNQERPSTSEMRLPQLLAALGDLKFQPLLAGGAAAAIGAPFTIAFGLMAIPTTIAAVLGFMAGKKSGLQLDKRGHLLARVAWIAALVCCIFALASA